MQYDNFAIGPNLSNGFQGTGAAAFSGRTNAWAFDLLNVVDAAVVVPRVAAQAESVPTLSEWAVVCLIGFMLVIAWGGRRRM